jgi:predicted CXXCH cytochrome family protein
MSSRDVLRHKLLGLLINFFIIFVPETVIAISDQNNQCLTCHVNFRKPDKYVHVVLSTGCETCHMAVPGTEHPREKNSIKLTQDVPVLCYNCHDEAKFKSKYIMPPVAGGQCTSCHNPHQSAYNMLLRNEIPGLCYMCHNKANFTKKYIHPPATLGCMLCHKPHASDYQYLLYSTINEVCTDCHKAQAKGGHVVSSFSGEKIHPVKGVPDPANPLREISCISCHNPHSSDFAKLFPLPNICQRCHKFY